MALSLEAVTGKKSAIDRAFKKGSSKPWRVDDVAPKTEPDDTANKQLTNSKQTANKQLTNSKQTANKQLTELPDDQMGFLRYSKQTANKQLTNSKQTANKNENFRSESADEFLEVLLRLSEQQQKLFTFIHTRCLENGDLSSGPIASHIFSTIINSSNNTVRTQLQRLISKNLLHRLPGKPGRGGFHAYSMTNLVLKAGNELRRHILNEFESAAKTEFDDTANKQLTNSKQTANTTANKPLSSSSNLIKTTTTRESESENENENFDLQKEIDITPLAEIGFRTSHLAQIVRRTDLSTDAIQSSIEYFAFDLKENQKGQNLKGSPLNFFMGILNKGVPYSPPDNFEDEKIKALKEFHEKQTFHREKLKKIEEDAKEIAFENWIEGLEENEITALLPPMLKSTKPTEKIKKLSLKGHYLEHEWPKIRANIFKEK